MANYPDDWEKTKGQNGLEAADSANTKAVAAQQSIDDFKETANATYASKTYVDDETKAITDEVSANYLSKTDAGTTYATKSDLTQSADSITSTVAETYTTKADFSALRVGAANLIPGTSDFSHIPGWWASSGTQGAIGSIGFGMPSPYMIDGTINAGGHGGWYYLESDFGPFELGQPYTISFLGSRSDAVKYEGLWGFEGNSSSTTFRVETTSFNPNIYRYICTFVPLEHNKGLNLYFSNNESGTNSLYFWLACPKLEKGSIATDWTPSIKDYPTSADAAATYATQTQVTQTASGLDTKITTAQTTADNAATAASIADGKAVAAQTDATDAQNRVTVQETLIRETSDGVDVGKSVDGEYPEGTPVTRSGSDGAFHIMKMLASGLKSIASFGADIEIGDLDSKNIHIDSDSIDFRQALAIIGSLGIEPYGTHNLLSLLCGANYDGVKVGGGQYAILDQRIADAIYGRYGTYVIGAMHETGAPRLELHAYRGDGTVAHPIDKEAEIDVGVDTGGNSYIGFSADKIMGYPFARFLTAIQPVVLYNGGAALTYDTAPGSGTNGTVTLSEDVSHFKELTITYRPVATNGPESGLKSETVPVCVGDYIMLDCVRWANDGRDVCQFVSASYLLSGTSLSYAARVYGQIYAGTNSGTFCGTDGGQPTIIRVEGIR